MVGGSQLPQLRVIRKKSDQLAGFLLGNALDQQDAWTYYFAIYLPAITYPLTATYFTQQQLHTLQKKALSVIISKCGFARSTSRAIIFAPTAYGGAGFRHLYVEQGIQNVLSLLRHVRADTRIGKLAIITLQWYHFQTGIDFDALQFPKKGHTTI